MSLLPCWKRDNDNSDSSKSPHNLPPRKVVPNHTVDIDIYSKSHPNYLSAKNQIQTTKYTLLTFLPKNLFEQFHRFANLYFLFIQVLNWIPGITAFAKEIQLLPLIFVLGVTAVKDIYEDRRRHRSDKRVNNAICRYYDSKNKRYVKTKWQNLCVGDIVHLSCNETVPADILLLRSSDQSGLCFVETANLDGENNLKQRQVIKGYTEKSKTFTPTVFKATIECDPPNPQIYKFNGFITEPNGEKIPINKDNLLLRDCVLKNTDFIDGIIVYAGHETKAMLNNGGPRSKRSKLERVMNRDVIWCVILLLLMCMIGSIGHGFWLSTFDKPGEVVYLQEGTHDRSPAWNAFQIFWTFVIIYQVMIPLSLYVTIELIKLGQIYHIHEDKNLHDKNTEKKVFCRALNITEDLGQIEYIFSDKTGTLTENHMVFRRCSIGGIDYNHEKPGSNISVTDDEANEEFLLNSYLKEELALISKIPDKDQSEYKLSTQSRRILDFFLLLAVCNSAMATKKPHKDRMSSSGTNLDKISPSTSPTPSNASTDTKASVKKLFAVLPNPFGSPSPKKEPSRSPSPMPSKPIYESESPDEVALVTAAYRYGIKLLKRNADMVMVSMPSEGILQFKVLNILPFDSTRKKMSVILRNPNTNKIVLYCKGSDTAIMDSLAKTDDSEMKNMIDITNKQLGSYSRKGLRTLCMSKRIISEEEYNKWNEFHEKAEQSLDKNEELLLQSHNRIEVNLELIGATGIEDSLQERVPEVIGRLRMAGIVVWVLTGDKLETAVNIAYSCRLFTKQMEIIYLKIERKEEAVSVIDKHLDDIYAKGVAKVNDNPKVHKVSDCIGQCLLIGTKVRDDVQVDTTVRSRRGIVIDGKTLTHVLRPEVIEHFLDLSQYCSSVLVCRATPLQKASVVNNVKEKMNVMTLAIGDGANDVAMIQTADVGIGISGMEGTQAVMASDFAIPRFHHLERLLLVHGNRSYFRLGRVVLYFFYKNASSVFIIFWFQLHCGFSGSVMIDQMYLMIVNAIFTSFPPMILGVYDKDCPSAILLEKPHLYSRGRKTRVYTEYSFWVNMFDALYQSLVMYFVPFIVYFDSSIGIWEFGTIIFTACVFQNLVHVSVEFKSWSLLHVLAISFSLVSYLMFAYVYNLLAKGSIFTSNAYMVLQNISYDPKFWISIILVLILATLPRIVMRAVQNSVIPSSITKMVKTIKEWSVVDETEDFLNNVPSKRKIDVSAVWTKQTSSVIMSRTGTANKLIKDTVSDS